MYFCTRINLKWSTVGWVDAQVNLKEKNTIQIFEVRCHRITLPISKVTNQRIIFLTLCSTYRTYTSYRWLHDTRFFLLMILVSRKRTDSINEKKPKSSGNQKKMYSKIILIQILLKIHGCIFSLFIGLTHSLCKPLYSSSLPTSLHSRQISKNRDRERESNQMMLSTSVQHLPWNKCYFLFDIHFESNFFISSNDCSNCNGWNWLNMRWIFFLFFTFSIMKTLANVELKLFIEICIRSMLVPRIFSYLCGACDWSFF